jgi:hypothetical protein
MTSWEVSTLTGPELENDNTHMSTYRWDYQGNTFTWEKELPMSIYEVQSRRHRVYDYGCYVADELTQSVAEEMYEGIRRQCEAKNFSSLETAEFAIRFVQSLEYTSDDISTAYDNYPRYPIETLIDEEGDCEDSSLLLAAILHKLGYKVILLELDNHLAVGLDIQEVSGNVDIGNGSYSYVEPTNVGWDIGEVPHRYEDQSVTGHKIRNSPSLYSVWEADTHQNRLDYTGLIANQGEGKAEDVVFQIKFEDSQGNVVSRVQERLGEIYPSSEVKWSGNSYIEKSGFVKPEWTIGIEGIIHDRGEGQKKFL